MYQILKRPKVQVWGGDIKTDKEVITSRTSNNVNVPDENLSRIELDKTSIRAKGLWGTGLDKDGNKIGGDVHFSPGEYGFKGGNDADPHWSIVCAEDQYGGNGNQRHIRSLLDSQIIFRAAMVTQPT